MIGSLTARLVEAYGDPRLSARRMLSPAPSIAEALIMALAGFFLFEFASRLFEAGFGVTMAEVMTMLAAASRKDVASPEDLAQVAAARNSAFNIVTGMGWQVLTTVITAYLTWRLGGLAGGGASFRQMLSLTGWWSIASMPAMSLGVLFMLLSHPGQVHLGFLAIAVAWFYTLFMFAAFVSEAHGFESVGSVFFAMLAVSFVFGVLLAPLGAA